MTKESMAPDPKPEAPEIGESAAFSLVRYARELRRFFARDKRRAHSAEDLVQETYLQLLRFPPKEDLREPEAYLYRVAWHVLTRFNREERRDLVRFDSELVEDSLEQVAEPEMNAAERLAQQRQIARILKELPPRTQVILLLCKRDGLSYKEIANRLGISSDAVKKHVMRGVLHFKNAGWS